MNACSTCGHEAYGEKHHGAHQLDLHHRPTHGAQVVSGSRFAHTLGWFHAAGDDGSYYAGLGMPDGTDDWVRVWPDGRREAVTVEQVKIAQAAREAELDEQYVASRS